MKPTSLLIPIVVMLLIVSIIEWMAFRLVKRRWDTEKVVAYVWVALANNISISMGVRYSQFNQFRIVVGTYAEHRWDIHNSFFR